MEEQRRLSRAAGKNWRRSTRRLVVAICLISAFVQGSSSQSASKSSQEPIKPNQFNETSHLLEQPTINDNGWKRRSSETALDFVTTKVATRGPMSRPSGNAIRAPNRRRRSPQAGQFNVMAPKLVQWSKEPVQYYEGSTLVLSCSLSVSGGEQPQLRFAWFRNNKPLTTQTGGQQQRLSIETLADYSFLRLADLRPSDSGAYTCMASNSLSQEDRTTTQVIVNVKLKWLPSSSVSAWNQDHQDRDEHAIGANKSSLVAQGGELAGGGHQKFVKSRAGQTVVFECNASGGSQPRPRVRWFRLAISGLGGLRPRAGGAQNAKASMLFPQETHGGSGGAKSMHETHASQLDETQIKLILNQLETPHADGTQMQRFELLNDGLQDKPAGQPFNDSFSGGQQQPKWRIETTSTPVNGNSKSGGQQQQQQHEIYSRLILERVEPSASGFYECEVGNTVATSTPLSSPFDNHRQEATASLLLAPSSSLGRPTQQSGDKLRRLFGLLVNGK